MFALSTLVVLCTLTAPPAYTVHVRDLTTPEVATRYAATGSVCVTDALESLEKPADFATVDVWVARPVAGGVPEVLRVDWAGITRHGRTATNYQLFAGDRLFVQAKPAK